MRWRAIVMIWMATWSYHFLDHGLAQTHDGKREFETKKEASEFLARCRDCRYGDPDFDCCDGKRLAEKKD